MEIHELYRQINTCLQKYNVPREYFFNINERELHFNKYITDLLSGNFKFYNALCNIYFPQSHLDHYNHFTSFAKFESIISSGSIFAFCVRRRFHENEFLTFYSNYGFDGYKDRIGENYPSLAEDICDNIYYISFTKSILSDEDNRYMWKNFGDEGNGVRLFFKINILDNRIAELRQMNYAQRLELLEELIQIANAAYLKLLFARISRIGFFNLPGDYSVENEHRLLINSGNFERGELDSFKYFRIPINTINPNGVEIVLDKIHVRSEALRKQVINLLALDSRFSNVVVDIEYSM
ncbi:hypothetical protein QM480_06710 [Flectobacillus sp. DC10W]|uniref:DUF2971 domain-containing protein n=1 Tax=Flectobacillus longus TaxID=2984207 RepID=A0ABT6YK89_9BACT|nr:hypothetical protein [Flectobacillus longus]MDI9864007.1 hypothetical protein [Flectobacillus longus]